MQRRILVHAPRGRDAEVVESVLASRAITTHRADSLAELVAALHGGAAGAIVTEEALADSAHHGLEQWLAQQPAWSDFPFIVLTTRRVTRRSRDAIASLHALGNVVLLERPVNAETLGRAAAAALRARDRQHETCRTLEELTATRATVERLNADLESRIAARTRELASANDRLMAEIAERERAQAVLVHVQKMEAIGRLTGGIAHDFNNLLLVVSMNLELLARIASDGKIAALAAKAKRAVGRGSKLTAQLLSFARAQSLLPRVTDVKALITGMQELVAVSAGSNVAVQLALCDEPVWASVDPSQLEMAILNLSVNARDAMPEGGTLTITARTSDSAGVSVDEAELKPGRYAVVSVADTGSGIPEHLVSKVFDPFFTTKPLGSGTGLGLSQVYGFAQQSGGCAHIETRIDHGTRVDMWFPLASHADASAPATDADTAVAARSSHHILVIEDDTEVRRVIVESLQLAGHSVRSAADGSAGLQALSQQAPDMLIVDYAMPGLNGAEVIRRARELRPDLPVVLATGYADMVEVGRVLGTQSILFKPFDIATLMKAVDKAMQPSTVPAA